jgi:hypothetical protein
MSDLYCSKQQLDSPYLSFCYLLPVYAIIRQWLSKSIDAMSAVEQIEMIRSVNRILRCLLST